MSVAKSDRVVVIGAGPVGLCLSLALAQDEIPVTLVETLGDDNFLEQVPRAGTNHPATLEMFDRIGLYEKIEPRGIIAPVFHYWDRHENRLIAAFDHIHLKDDTDFPYVLQCERIKIVEEALKMAKAHPLIDLRLRTTFRSFEQDADRVIARVTNPAGEEEVIEGRYIVSGEGARSIIRKDLGIDFEGFTYSDRTLLIAIFRGEADDDVLDRYERQRRHVAIKHRQADTIRNKRLLAEKDSAVRQKNNDQLRRTSEDPQLARAFLPPSSLIESIREADQIQ